LNVVELHEDRRDTRLGAGFSDFAFIRRLHDCGRC